MSDLTITLVQTDISWEQKEANLKMYEDKLNTIPKQTEVVVLPEMFTTGFSMNPSALAEEMNGATMQWLKQQSSVHRKIITGSIIINEQGNYYNRLIWMQPDGNFGFYDKRHLFCYASEDKYYTAGTKRLVSSVKGWRVNLQICYDLRFPVWCRQQQDSEPEFDLQVFVANWPAARSTAWQTLLRARAIENQCYVIGVNRVGEDGKGIPYSGNSMVIDPLGEILYNKENQEDIFTISLKKEKLTEVRSKFPFWKDADDFLIRG